MKINQLSYPGIQDEKNKNHSLNYGHNPILNPNPYNVQNPYLKKEYQKFLKEI